MTGQRNGEVHVMRESDRILAADFRAAGLEHLAARAERGEWNDYFGSHTMPQYALIATLRAEVKLANPVRKQLIAQVVDGKYDGTIAESEEWAASPEGQSVFGSLLGEGHDGGGGPR
jgi:hypothetical protein